MEKKKIAILLPSLADGGAEKVMVYLANYFSIDYKVDLILISKSGVYFKMLNSNVRLVNLNSKRSILAIPKILIYLYKEKPNVLLSALTHINIIALICKLFFFNSVRVVISERTIISKSTILLNSKYKLIKIFLIKFLYQKADMIIAISNACADDIVNTIKISKNNIIVIYNPLLPDVNFNENNNSKKQKSILFDNYDGRKIIIAVGRLIKSKNFLLLIRAFNILKKSIPSKLIILGEGPERKQLELLINELNLISEVELLGFVENPLDYYKISDVFVSTSLWEGFGNAILDAMSVGLKIVAFDCPGGPREILENGKWGKLVQHEDEKLLAEAIIDSILNNNINYDTKERADQFNFENIAQKYLLTFNL